MSLDSSFVGRSYPRAATYEVGREKIREFADAIGDDDALYRDPDAARAAGYDEVIAPPTFTTLLALRAQDALVGDPELGLDYSRLVHGDQSFTHHRPVRAGDALVAELHVDAIRSTAAGDMLTVRCEITDDAGGAVTTARSLLVVRAEGAA